MRPPIACGPLKRAETHELETKHNATGAAPVVFAAVHACVLIMIARARAPGGASGIVH
jgi:hypothetical protein